MIPATATYQTDMWKFCPCALYPGQHDGNRNSPYSRERYDLDESHGERHVISVHMRNRKRLRNRVIPKPRMQNLNHMVWIEVDVELELFHVAWNDVRRRVNGAG